MKTIITLIAVAILSSFAISAEDADVAVPVRAEADKAPLNENMKPLGFFEGKWQVEQRIKAGKDQEVVTHGMFSVERGLLGRALIGEFEGQEHHQGKFMGHMVITADKDAQRYGVYWADSQGITTFTPGASFEGNKLTISSEDKSGEKQGKARLTYTKDSDDKIEFEMSAETPKGWETHVTGTYTRMKGER